MIDWQDADGLPKRFEGEAFHFAKGEIQSFFQNAFDNCSFKLEEGAGPEFYGCLMSGCTFDPPIIAVPGQGINPQWDPLLRLCVIQSYPKEGMTWSTAAPVA